MERHHITRIVNRFVGIVPHASNSTFAIGGVFPLERDRLCSAGSFVVAESSVLRINICGENRHLRQPRNRYASCYDDRANIKLTDKKYDITRRAF